MGSFYLRNADIIMGMKHTWDYGAFGEVVFYRTYSRIKSNGYNESWNDVVLRVINGVFSIRKDYYIANGLYWDEDYYQYYATKMAISMHKMEWLPPGRGLWMMGTKFIEKRGAMALYNCAFTKLETSFDYYWLMDCLMLGCGVGFEPCVLGLKLNIGNGKYKHYVLDSREGWCESVKLLIEHYENGAKKPIFDYSLIRYGEIKGFGGYCNGPENLMRLHLQISEQYQYYDKGEISELELRTNIANQIGVCVISGNVRRSAEIALSSWEHSELIDLKNYKKYPRRVNWGWISNNSMKFCKTEDFENLKLVAERVVKNGEPGAANLMNFKYARMGDLSYGIDEAIGLNPCGEIPLENKEVCNVVETFPTRAENWLTACEYATWYASTISLKPTHHACTNKIIAKNRRIGVGIVDFASWKLERGLHNVIRDLREGYKVVRQVNKELAIEAGIRPSLRVTTVKPGGTVPKLAGRIPGIGHPTFKYTIRAIRIPKYSPLVPILIDANYRYEPSIFDENTLVFYFPVEQGPARPSTEVSLWEQAMNLVTVQREWADNSVSNTLYFKPAWPIDRIYKGEKLGDNEILDGEYVRKFNPEHEEWQIENVLSSIMPVIKSVSLIPHTEEGVYEQMPESCISEEGFRNYVNQLKPLDLSELKGVEAQPELYCTGDYCELK